MTEERFFELCKYERQLESEGYTLIAGVDEAGRGPLAGPVSAACVIYKVNGPFVKGADDSKKISEKKREALFDEMLARRAEDSVLREDGEKTQPSGQYSRRWETNW